MPQAATDAVTQIVWEGATPILLARVVGMAGANITQASLNSLAYMVVKDVAGVITTVIAETSLTIADIIFDTLQTDAIWTKDSTGYNFKHQLAATDIPDPSTKYRVQHKLVDTNSLPSFIEFILPTKPQYFD